MATTSSKGVDLSGVTITRVTANNGKFILDNLIGPGAIIRISRRGDVIPHVEEIVKPAKKAQMPEGEWHWSAKGVDIILDDLTSDDAVLTKKLLNFFTTIGADNIGTGVINKLIEAGYDTPTKIIQLPEAKWSRIPGFEGVMGGKLYRGLEKALSDIELPTLADATGFFGRGFGTTRFTSVQSIYPKIRALGALPNQEIVDKVSGIHGFSEATATAFAQGIKPFLKWFDRNSEYITLKRKAKPTSNALEGVVVSFTGFRDQDLAERIRKAGGLALDNLKTSTTILLATDPDSGSAKITQARARGVKIMTPDAFVSKYKV